MAGKIKIDPYLLKNPLHVEFSNELRNIARVMQENLDLVCDDIIRVDVDKKTKM